MTIHLTLEQAFLVILLVIAGVLILAEVIGEIRWRMYLERRRRETMRTVRRGRQPW
jgi:hypothetical protein